MRVLDPGHCYELAALDGDNRQTLQFVKRKGDHYPGNVGEARSGTTLQEQWRADLERLRYVNGQIPCAETQAVIHLIETAILLLEIRAKRVKGKTLELPNLAGIDQLPACPKCGHVLCQETHA